MFKQLVLVALLFNNGDAAHRHLQGKPTSIAGFEPLTDVRDQARIDLDQQAIVQSLAAGNFDNALKLYQEGAFSKSVSLLTVVPDASGTAGIPVDIAQGTKLTGKDSTGGTVAVKAQGSSYTVGDTQISIQYLDEGCYVGANPNPVTDGCLAPQGTLTVDGTTFSYDYDPLSSSNVYSIQLFTDRNEYSFAPGDPLTVDFKKFVDFYDSESYADDIIKAAVEGKSTSFSTGKNLDASLYGNAGRAEIAQKFSAYGAVWMYVIRELEHAIYLCETGDCAEESCLGKAAVHEVDEAVAFYVGSLEGADGSGQGVLTYDLADRKAQVFGTLAGTTANLNQDLIEEFKVASDHIVNAKCPELRDDTTKIVQLMTVPLVQGTLQYTALSSDAADGQDTTISFEAAVKSDEQVEASRAALAATVLPFVAACSAADADTIYENSKTGATAVDYEAVKSAFERNYACMGITVEDIGTLPTITDSSDSGDADSGVSGSLSHFFAVGVTALLCFLM